MKSVRVLPVVLLSVLITTGCFDLTGPGPYEGSVDVIRNSAAPLSGSPSSALTEPLVIQVIDRGGEVVPGAEVRWQVKTGGGVIEPEVSFTDAEGFATAVWQLGQEFGEQRATAKVRKFKPAEFTATAAQGSIVGARVEPSAIAIGKGDQADLGLVAWDEGGHEFPVTADGWVSSDPGIASVDMTGKLTAIGVGATAVAGVYFGMVGTTEVAVTQTATAVPVVGAELPPVGDPRIMFDTRRGAPQDLNKVSTLEQALSYFPDYHVGSGLASLGFTLDQNSNGQHAFLIAYTAATKDNQPGETKLTVDLRDEPHVFVSWRAHHGRTATGDGVSDGPRARGMIGVYYPGNLYWENRGGKRMRLVGTYVDGQLPTVTHVWNGGEGGSERIGANPVGGNWADYTGRKLYSTQTGRTEQWVYEFKAHSSPDAKDGEIRFWVNGEVVYENTGIVLYPSDRAIVMTRLNSPYVDQTEYVWDILAWTP